MEEQQTITIQIKIPDNFQDKLGKILSALTPDPQPEKTEDELLTADEVCEILKLKKSQLYGLTMQKHEDAIPRRKIRKELRFVRSEVMAWVDRQGRI